ncbi:MAG: hypothetical protein E7624_08650 [Ruminococcaceae bacterium]|nr:hypothetical protein [Oscillospiraceae bacterium]
MAEKLVCPICGEPTRVYMGNARKDRLCGKHADMLKAGDLILSADGKYTVKGEPKPEPKAEPVAATSDLTCIICGEPSNGKHFCVSCYHEYKNRSVDIRLKNLKFEMILDDYGNLKYKCEDGRYVRSLQEQSIANTLWSLDIKYVYEEKVYYYTEEENAKSISPDFFLPKYNLYIEHIGFTSKKHDSITQYKQKIYDEQGKKVIFTSPENLQDFKDFIKRTLKLN